MAGTYRVSAHSQLGTLRFGILRRGLRAALVGYLLGTLPSAKVAARVFAPKGTDITATGSGNPGAANATALLGKRIGAAVLAADAAKAAGASVAGRAMLGTAGAHIGGTAAVIGHCYPAWSGFRKGGKGVACSIGQMLATFPAYVPVDIGLGWFMARSDRWRTRQTESTAAACVLWVVLGSLWHRRQLPNLWGGRPTLGLPLSAAVSGAVIVRRFREEEAAQKSREREDRP